MSRLGRNKLELELVFKRIRQLRISLAAKCQLLFGTAVVMIISAWRFLLRLMVLITSC